MSKVPKPPKLPRCTHCKKKMDLVDRVTCQKCKNLFCIEHRYYETHKCPVFEQEIKDEKNKLDGEFSNARKMYENNKKYDELIKDMRKNSTCRDEANQKSNKKDNTLIELFKSLLVKTDK